MTMARRGPEQLKERGKSGVTLGIKKCTGWKVQEVEEMRSEEVLVAKVSTKQVK